jgi:hypothetical protein
MKMMATNSDIKNHSNFSVTSLHWKNTVSWDVKPCGSCRNRCFGGTPVPTRATRRNIPEDTILDFYILGEGILHSHRRGNRLDSVAET